MDDIIKFFENSSNIINKWWNKHNIVRCLLHFSPLFSSMFFLYIKVHGLWYLIIFIPLLLAKFDIVMKVLGIIIDYTYRILSWIYYNYGHTKETVMSVIVMILALLALICISISCAYLFLNSWKEELIAMDIVNGKFLYEFAALAMSSFIMFFLSLIFHMIYIKFKFDEWSYLLMNIILAFLVAVFFAALLGLSVTLSDYADLFARNYCDDYKLATGYDAEIMKFTVKSMTNIIVYGLFALIAAFQVSFNIAYRSELKRKKQLETNESE